MRVVFDNNVIIDVLNPNEKFYNKSQEALNTAYTKKVEGFVAANSLTDIYYIIRKVHGSEKSMELLRALVQYLNIIPLDPLDCITALNLPMSDFEDAIIAVCAKKINADYVVSRDEKFINSSSEVKVITPNELLEVIEH